MNATTVYFDYTYTIMRCYCFWLIVLLVHAQRKYFVWRAKDFSFKLLFKLSFVWFKSVKVYTVFNKLNNGTILFIGFLRVTWVMFADREAETGADCPSAWRSQVYSFHALLCTLGWNDFWYWCWLSLCLAQSGLQYSFHSLLCALGWSDFWEREQTEHSASCAKLF